MVKLNYGLIACGLVGAILVLVLPIAEAGPITVKLLDTGGHGYLTLACLLVGGAMGVVGLSKPARWSGAVALVAFLIAGMKLSGADTELVKAGAGADGGMILAFFGMLIALALTIKPGKKT